MKMIANYLKEFKQEITKLLQNPDGIENPQEIAFAYLEAKIVDSIINDFADRIWQDGYKSGYTDGRNLVQL